MHVCANCGGIDAIELPYYSAEFGGWMLVCDSTGAVSWLRHL